MVLTRRDETRTENDTTNAAMLHINTTLGFQLEPPWIILETARGSVNHDVPSGIQKGTPCNA